jgi:hypothetical protein
VYFLVEAFRNAAAGEAHLNSDHFKAAIARMPGLLADRQRSYTPAFPSTGGLPWQNSSPPANRTNRRNPAAHAPDICGWRCQAGDIGAFLDPDEGRRERAPPVPVLRLAKGPGGPGQVFADPYGAEAWFEFCPHHPRECRIPGREDCPRVHLVPGVEQAGP